MTESKIDIHTRKVRNGKRRGAKKVERREKHLMWKKLASKPKRNGVLMSPGVHVTEVDSSVVLTNTPSNGIIWTTL